MNASDDPIIESIHRLRDQGLIDAALAKSLLARLSRLAELESDFAAALLRAKLAALKEFAYGASHEINNPLANIASRGQALLAEEKHPERRKRLATIVAQAFRAHEMISDLMLFAKPTPLARKLLRVSDVISTVTKECEPDAKAQGTELLTAIEPADLQITADETQLAVAIKALIRNAIEALGQEGTIEVSASVDEGHVIIAVNDTGPGLSEHVREHLFDPFFSGREAGRGLGFGLCKCWRIAELHGGRVEVESELSEGTTMRLVLPVT